MNNDKEVSFPTYVFITAAQWWAQFLPGAKQADFNEIIKNKKIEGVHKDNFQVVHQMLASREDAITTEQYWNFVTILANKITKISLSNGLSDGLFYFQLGHSSSYEPPQEVVDAMEEAGIKGLSFGRFPYKTQMRIYNNGQIQVDKNVYSTNPECRYFDTTMDFSLAPYMAVMGEKFRIIDIKLDELKSKLVYGHFNDNSDFKIERHWDDPKDEIITHVYTSIQLKHFKGTEEEFLNLKNDELVEILQDKEKVKKYFKESAFFYYEKSPERLLKETSYMDVGKVTPERIGDNYYQYSTGPVKVMSAPQNGTVGSYSLTPVVQGDLLIKRDNEDSLSSLSKNHSEFSAKLCDKNCKILSNTAFTPGDILPVPPNATASLVGIFRQLLTPQDDNADYHRSKITKISH